jgi:hypothetical protein
VGPETHVTDHLGRPLSLYGDGAAIREILA